jgi:hypothetical protein
MPLRKAGIFLGFTLMLASLAALIWGYLSPKETTTELEIPGLGGSVLLWTPVIRSADEGRVSLSIDPIESGIDGRSIAPVNLKPGFAGQNNTGSPAFNTIAEARLDLAGMEILPNQTMTQRLSAGNPVSFNWAFASHGNGNYTGQVWLYTVDVSRAGLLGDRQPVSVQPVAVRSVEFLGLGGPQMRLLGFLGILLAGILSAVLGWRRERSPLPSEITTMGG